MPDLPLPLGFRAEILAPVAALLRAGESCALVGVGSSGKSNVARHLARADVRAHYFAEAAPQSAVVYLNCKPFAGRPPHELYLHALDQLERALADAGGLAEASPEAARLWQEAQVNPESLARRNLDRAAARAVEAGALHLILVLDDCDDLFAQAPPVFFSELRALRDNHKVRLAYLTLTRREPVFLRPETKEFEELFELLHTLPVPPYTEADALTMIRRLAARQVPPTEMTDEAARQLFAWSGGHAGLIRALFFAAQGRAAAGPDELAADADVGDECRKIWVSLEREEQRALLATQAGHPAAEEDLRRLERRGLLRRAETAREVFSPIFARFLGQFAGEPRAGPAGMEPAEEALLRRLEAARPGLCARAELLEAMRQGEQHGRSGEGVGDPLRRLEQYLRRLNARLAATGRRISARADGYALE